MRPVQVSRLAPEGHRAPIEVSTNRRGLLGLVSDPGEIFESDRVFPRFTFVPSREHQVIPRLVDLRRECMSQGVAQLDRASKGGNSVTGRLLGRAQAFHSLELRVEG